MNLFVVLGGYATINETLSDTEQVVIGLFFDNRNNADYDITRGETRIRCYKVKKSGTNNSGLTDDMKSVYLGDNTTIEISRLMRHINHVTFNPTTGVLSKYPGRRDVDFDVAITIPTDIPMAFKRANTVVNLGRL